MSLIEKKSDNNDSIMDYLDEPSNITDNNEPIILGIDLGTTNSSISIWRNNNCEIIPDEYGNKTIPSFVSYTNVSKYVGSEAKNQKDINIENVFYEVKRLIGRTYIEKPVQDCKELLSYNIIENERGCVSIQSTIRNNKIFTPEEISATILMKLKDMAQRYLKRDIKDVVITVPAHFNDSQRQSTYDAAKIAGLNCVRMFHEPTAAALAYGMMDRSINKSLNDNGMLILVYDFGGGTLDVSLIDIYDGAFDVQGSSGISHFGGVDFDNRIINYCIAKFSRQYYNNDNKFDIKRLSRLYLQKLRKSSESSKKILSTNTHAIIAIENFYDNKDLFVKISRSDLENLCRDLFLLCINSIDELLLECGKTENDIDEIILVGGMTRMPYIRELLNNKFKNINGKNRVNCSINPDEAVSVGASIQGYIIANKNDPFSDSVTLMDVTPLSLGVEVIGGVMDILIKRNTMIPCEKTKLYSTDTDYVDSVLVKIFEGERTMTSHNYKIGEFLLDNLPKCHRGIPEIEITFAIDINGIVTVTAIEKDVNEKKTIIVNTNKNGLTTNQLQVLIDEASEQETMDEIDRVKKYSYYEIDDLCSNVISNINNKEFKLSVSDKELISKDISNIGIWLKEKIYKDRSLDEYVETLQKMKKKYGVLILHGKLEESNVKGSADHMEATTLYGKEDDEEEEEMRQAFEKVKKDELGGAGMSNAELIEIKEMRTALMDICKNVNNIICSGRMNISNNHKQEILHYIDDVMMWYYSHEKPTKYDYKEKIDYINSVCDEIVINYENDGKELFVKGLIDSNNDTNSQKLEKLCLTLITMINNKQITPAKCNSGASFALFTSKINNILKMIYSNSIDVLKDDNYESKCLDYINEINNMCDNIYNNMQNINIKNEPTVYLSKDIHNDEQGMTLIDLLKSKQNDEIDEMIKNQLDSNIEVFN